MDVLQKRDSFISPQLFPLMKNWNYYFPQMVTERGMLFMCGSPEMCKGVMKSLKTFLPAEVFSEGRVVSEQWHDAKH